MKQRMIEIGNGNNLAQIFLVGNKLLLYTDHGI